MREKLRSSIRYKRAAIIWPFIFLAVLFLQKGTAWSSFTLDDEKKLGREFYEKLEKGNALSQNEAANKYITRLGERILAHSDKVPFDFKFSIVRSTAINAFATPGGYVYVNQGLINLVENEGQLAGVLAHEIAHVNGRHIAEIVDKSKAISIASLAAILAGAFLGGSTDAMAAVTSFTMATATALSLKYSREQEEAADRAGLSYLTAAGYSGQGMLEFLKIMKRYEYYSNSIPSYFLTHPGTDERTRYIDALLQTTYPQPGANDIIGNLKRIQTILLLSGKTTESHNLEHFQKILTEYPGDVDALYGLAYTQDKLGMSKESIDSYRKVLNLAPNDSDILRDLGITLFKLGKFDDAAVYLDRALRVNDNDSNAVLYTGKTAEARGDLTNAIRFYRRFEQNHPDDQEIYYNLAMAYGSANQPGDSHYYFGLYFKKKNKIDSALFHFKAAQAYFQADSPRSKEIAQELKTLGHR
jgi:beta-barrel assembly-enhancing protease